VSRATLLITVSFTIGTAIAVATRPRALARLGRATTVRSVRPGAR
jgi:hypothetical protein